MTHAEIDKLINEYFKKLNLKQKKAVLAFAKTIAESNKRQGVRVRKEVKVEKSAE